MSSDLFSIKELMGGLREKSREKFLCREKFQKKFQADMLIFAYFLGNGAVQLLFLFLSPTSNPALQI